MRYSMKFKQKMVEKMTGPGSTTPHFLAREAGVPATTLGRWLKETKVPPMSKRQRSGRSRWTGEEKVRVVMEAAATDEEKLGVLLRREGLHQADLDRFRQEVLNAANEGLRPKPQRSGPSPEQKKIRALEKELARKEKALAEAAALLVLRKKAEAFFLGEEEGDTTSSNDD